MSTALKQMTVDEFLLWAEGEEGRWELHNATLLVNLIVIVEVLSPSTAAIDHGRKLSGYFSLASVQHYLILDPERRVAIHHKRAAGEAIETRVLTGGVARLDPPGFEVAIEALFPQP
jgi:Uma2 family endonuclease